MYAFDYNESKFIFAIEIQESFWNLFENMKRGCELPYSGSSLKDTYPLGTVLL